MSFRNFGKESDIFMKLKRYTVTENLISILIAIVIAVPVCFGAYKSQVLDYRREPIDMSKYTVEVAPVVKEIEETPEVINEPVIECIELGEFEVTAYCPCSSCCDEWADGLTYTETVATEGRTIAVDPEVIPLGSTVEIDGVEYIAEDIGGAVKGNHIDMFFSSHEDALTWGVQYHDVCIVNFFD